MTRPIYLDYNATTPVDPRVLELMLPYFGVRYGNPSSKRHAYGWEADEAVTVAREHLATLLHAEPVEILFTSGATEAANLGIKGYAEANAGRGRHLVTVATEHKAVLESCKSLARRGWDVTILPVAADGTVAPSDVAAALRPDTVLVAVMWANNETGVLHDIPAISHVVRAHGAALFCDATQAVGKVPVDAGLVDLLACSGHKLYGPKGVGALYVGRRDRRARITPLVEGGGQENGLRGGTLNVPGIVGLGEAARIAALEMAADPSRVAGSAVSSVPARFAALRDAIEARLLASVPGLRLNGGGAERLPNTSSLHFPGVTSADLLAEARGVALSTGSACSSGTGTASHALKAMGLSDAEGSATVRLSVGRFTTDDEAASAADEIARAWATVTSRRAGHAAPVAPANTERV